VSVALGLGMNVQYYRIRTCGQRSKMYRSADSIVGPVSVPRQHVCEHSDKSHGQDTGHRTQDTDRDVPAEMAAAESLLRGRRQSQFQRKRK
jgi:hypothetical protein